MDYTICIGGEAGQGIQTIGSILARIMLKGGYYVFTTQDYMSRIRGGHNFYTIRFSDTEITASRNQIDLLVALNHETIQIHRKRLTSHAMVVYDSSTTGKDFSGDEFLDIPFREVAIKEAGSAIMENTVATAAVVGMLGMRFEICEEVIKEIFKKKGDTVVEKNLRAARAGYELAINRCLKCNFQIPEPTSPKGILINGNDAIAFGAIVSGCSFYAAYPMTPSTGILNTLSAKASKYQIIVEQAEDEIAAINMAIGASFAGVRAMTGTSGGGFALMVEGVSLAAMTETPIVIAEVQRPGPATGLPTRTEQADLLFVLYAGHGEFPKVVFAPGTPEQAFYLTNRAFDLAERFQIPVFILSDQYLADSEWTLPPLSLKKTIYRDYRLRKEKLSSLQSYKRHALTDNGISPLAVPGESEHLVITDSDEHDEEGHLIEDAELRRLMVEKRLFKKLPLIKGEINPPELYGDSDADTVLLCWGSTYGVVKETVDHLADRIPLAMIHFSELYPFPEYQHKEWFLKIKKAKKTIAIEQNATCQFVKLLRSETSLEVTDCIKKYDGRPFTLDELITKVQAVVWRR